jgi:hypothetical protein
MSLPASKIQSSPSCARFTSTVATRRRVPPILASVTCWRDRYSFCIDFLNPSSQPKSCRYHQQVREHISTRAEALVDAATPVASFSAVTFASSRWSVLSVMVTRSVPSSRCAGRTAEQNTYDDCCQCRDDQSAHCFLLRNFPCAFGARNSTEPLPEGHSASAKHKLVAI